MATTIENRERLEVESLALTRIRQEVERWVPTVPEGSWARERLEELAADLWFDSEVSTSMLCEVLAEAEAEGA